MTDTQEAPNRLPRPYDDGDPTRQILVEGSDDFHFLYHWLSESKLLTEFCFKATGSDDKLFEVFPVSLKGSDLKCLGLLVDADGNPEGRLTRINQELVRAGYAPSVLPKAMSDEGTIIESPGLPMIGIWVMPNNSDNGCLETFMSMLIDEGDVLWPLAIQSVDQAKQVEQRFKDCDEPKARIETWLAWQSEPGLAMGQAITAKIFKRETPVARAFEAWLNRLSKA